MDATAHMSEREVASELRLRADRPRVTRLSRKVLVVLAGVSAVAIAGAVAYGMTNVKGDGRPAETYNVGGPPPEQLARLPRDYGAAPKLGPPLPGDLGRPLLASNVAPPPTGATPGPDPAIDAARQQALQAREAARTSRLFASDARSEGGGVALASGEANGAAATVLQGAVDRQTVSPDRLTSPPSPFVVQAGALIPAALVTGIRSDLPGQIVGQVTENVFDTLTGRYLLIPQGSRLIGVYDTRIAFGQKRVLLAWTRLILPNGRSLVLEKLPAGDARGYAGLNDRTDRHWGELFGAAALSTVLGIGAELGAGEDDSEVLRALRQGVAGTLNQVGQQAVGRSLSIPPTLTIRPGAPVRVMVTRDLVLEPYRP